MTPDEFRAAQRCFGLHSTQMAEMLGVCDQTVRRWRAGIRAVPEWAALILGVFAQYPEAKAWADERRRIAQKAPPHSPPLG